MADDGERANLEEEAEEMTKDKLEGFPKRRSGGGATAPVVPLEPGSALATGLAGALPLASPEEAWERIPNLKGTLFH